MDQIHIYGLKVYAYHGVFVEETQRGQTFVVNATLYTDTAKAGWSDDLEHSTNYGSVAHFITSYLQDHTFKLLEAAVEHLARALLLEFPLVEQVKVELQKPNAPIALPFETVSVEITREWHTVYLSFGSNLGDSDALVKEGLEKLRSNAGIRRMHVSSLFETAPYGVVDQPNFLNGCAEIQTVYAPLELLDLLHKIEKEAGRERKVHWGPRTLDLDILFYDDLELATENLCIPHVDMQNRLFVLEPLLELCPRKKHPIFGKTVEEMYNDIWNNESK